MLRRLFQLSAFLSAFCLLCILILWPLSYYRDFGVLAVLPGETAVLTHNMPGRIFVLFGSTVTARRPPRNLEIFAEKATFDNEWSKWTYLTWGPTRFEPFGTYLGVSCGHEYMVGNWFPHLLAIPFSYLTLLASILPTLALISIRRRKNATLRGFPIATTTPPN